MPSLQISAKDLGLLNSDDFCEKCFWIKRHDRDLPYQMPFPSIFYSIDGYTKFIIKRYFARYKRLPSWLGGIGDVKTLVEVPQRGYSITRGSITITGIPDQPFQRNDGSYGIFDYKTAKYSAGQDRLMPIYNVQLNGYAYMMEELGMKPVNSLYLVYFEPPSLDEFEKMVGEGINKEGFEMPFRPVIHEITRNFKMVEELLQKAIKIYSLNKPPNGRTGCPDCKRLNELIRLVA
ncbi:MAG: PD-(D/E)XK nuclease family protein [Nitrososphaerota archaeon]|nr:PD-(D/E)XK nuclease family protein [Nitrososphaerota archaeon]MDG7041522.1 PD-(D/E)XK nuclease family protein [Nitrososphaerota archaeon]MDG7046870.1 PD-(D/E)XK nuclease family protein [Nitrososphaerota archaeon]